MSINALRKVYLVMSICESQASTQLPQFDFFLYIYPYLRCDLDESWSPARIFHLLTSAVLPEALDQLKFSWNWYYRAEGDTGF